MTSTGPANLRSRGASTKSERAATPPWLTDVNLPAPCPCGRPLHHGEAHMWFVSRDTGLKRLFHLECARDMGLLED